MRINKFAYVLGCNVLTFIIVDLVTGIGLIAALCAVISGYLAARDWEHRKELEESRDK